MYLKDPFSIGAASKKVVLLGSAHHKVAYKKLKRSELVNNEKKLINDH